MKKTTFKKGDWVFPLRGDSMLYQVKRTPYQIDLGKEGGGECTFFDLVDSEGMVINYQLPEEWKKAKPIIYSTDMVRANLNGLKSQTRRLNGLHKINKDPDRYSLLLLADEGVKFEDLHNPGWIETIKYPFGQSGDILYVRETFAKDMADGFIYRADHTGVIAELPGQWKPSIHMPAKAARIFLKIEDIKVERLQGITEGDCLAEGIDREFRGEVNYYKNYRNDKMEHISPSLSFEHLWQSINAKRAPWESNPWVWALTTSRVKPQ